jgi:hypothetical protein
MWDNPSVDIDVPSTCPSSFPEVFPKVFLEGGPGWRVGYTKIQTTVVVSTLERSPTSPSEAIVEADKLDPLVYNGQHALFQRIIQVSTYDISSVGILEGLQNSFRTAGGYRIASGDAANRTKTTGAKGRLRYCRSNFR